MKENKTVSRYFILSHAPTPESFDRREAKIKHQHTSGIVVQNVGQSKELEFAFKASQVATECN